MHRIKSSEWIRLREWLHAIIRHHGYVPEIIMGHTKTQAIVNLRMLLVEMLLTRIGINRAAGTWHELVDGVPQPALERLSYPEVGALVSKDHSSIVHLVHRRQKMLAEQNSILADKTIDRCSQSRLQSSQLRAGQG